MTIPLSNPGRIDVHSHLLPGVDDGCATVAESLACARMLVEAGYTHSFCTPHIWPNLPRNTIANITQWVGRFQQELDEAQIPLRLFPGGELNLREDMPTAVRPEEMVTYAMNRRHVLIDFWSDRLPPFFEPVIRWLQSLSLTVILAHPERLRAVQDEPELADYFAEIGVLMQGNLQCLGDAPGTPTRITVERFLQEDRYFLLGSDLHNLATLPMRLEGMQVAMRLVGPGKIDQLTKINPRLLLA